MKNRTGRRFLSSAYPPVIQRRSRRSIDFGLIFLPFMCHLRFLEISLDHLREGTENDFKILSSLIRSLFISLTSPEHLKFNLWFCSYRKISPYFPYTFYDDLRNVWSPLDSITVHSIGSRLQRVDISIGYGTFKFCGVGERPDKNEMSKAILDGLPLLRMKGILYVGSMY